jgi:flagellar motility protein MotE (MotC chaperone)
MNVPRLLPLVGVAIAGVVGLKALSGVTELPDMVQGAKAWAEGVVPKKAEELKDKSGNPVLPPDLSLKPAPGSPAAVAAATQPGDPAIPRLSCGPSAADLAKEAGLSPAELQVLQSLQGRRGQLDQREQDLDAQLRLLSAAEMKLDGKLAALTSMKTEIQALLDKADQKASTETDRLVVVYSKMKPQDAAARFTLLDDAVRIPIAARMKEAALSQIMGKMPPADAKTLTEKLARRFESKALADAKAAIQPGAPNPSAAPAATAAAPTAPAPTAAAATPDQPPKPKKVAKRKPKPKATTETAANTTAPPKDAPKPPAAAPTAPASPAPAGAAPPKAG